MGAPALAQAQAQAAAATPENRWSDSAEIVIRPTEITVPGLKRCPAMWKLKRGGASLFILADVLAAPDGLQWDSSCFAKTLQGANALLLQGEWNDIPARDKLLPTRGDLPFVISRPTYDRLTVDAQRLHLAPDEYESYRPQWAFTPLLQVAYDQLKIHLETYPVTVPGLARHANVPIRKVAFFQGNVKTRNVRNQLDAAGAEDCLNAGLDRLDYTLDVLPGLANAWAQSDMVTVLKLFPDPQFGRCVPKGDTSDRDLQTNNMKNWTDAMDAALNQPGKTVAVVPLDWLLYKGGALDQLKGRGVDVIAPVEDGE